MSLLPKTKRTGEQNWSTVDAHAYDMHICARSSKLLIHTRTVVNVYFNQNRHLYTGDLVPFRHI